MLQSLKRKQLTKFFGAKPLVLALNVCRCISSQTVFIPKHTPARESDIGKLKSFIKSSERLFVMTGAGISTESGIPDYRSEGVGLYATSQNRPILYQDFIQNDFKRKRYWARNYVGWPRFSSVQPNLNHLILADWEKRGLLHWLVTQNVDALHTKAGHKKLTELHGCTHNVDCLNCGEVTSRHHLQRRISNLNPTWKVFEGDIGTKQFSIKFFDKSINVAFSC